MLNSFGFTAVTAVITPCVEQFQFYSSYCSHYSLCWTVSVLQQLLQSLLLVLNFAGAGLALSHPAVMLGWNFFPKTRFIYCSWTYTSDFFNFQLNQPTRCSRFSSLWLVIQIQLNMFRAPSCPSSGATTTAVAASGLPSELSDSSFVGRGRAGRPDHDQQHCYHQAPTENQRLLLQLL